MSQKSIFNMSLYFNLKKKDINIVYVNFENNPISLKFIYIKFP